MATPPPIKTTTFSRAIGALSIVILVAAVPILVARLMSPEEPRVESPAASTSTVAAPQLGPLQPIGVDCSSDAPRSACQALIDDDPETIWSAFATGDETEIIFHFSPPVTMTNVSIQNISDELGFRRHARVATYELHLSDAPQAVIGEIPDTPGSHDVVLSSMALSSLTLHITSVYPGEHVGEEEPHDDVALQGISFIGHPNG